PNMSIRVGHQDPESKLLNEVLIYDNRNLNGNMTTIVADSGYIRLSDSKKFLMVTLFHGESYEQTRNSQWYNKSALTHNIFDRQDLVLSMSGFSMERSDANDFNNSQTKNINELQRDIDSLEVSVNEATTQAYGPLLGEQIFARDKALFANPGDSLYVDKSGYRKLYVVDSLPPLPLRDRNRIWDQARTAAKGSRNRFSSFDEENVKNALNQLYRNKVEWHRKISLPFSIMIFFLIGAPLGAIIRKGGLGTPIVISVIFFVFYYIISISGEKMAKEGNWDAVYGMWISSIILTPIAVYLTHKATNDSALLDVEWYEAKIKLLKEKLGIRINKRKKQIKTKYDERKQRVE
ncbi:MAG: LptF/LptG family permease, partial [Alistipes sp.]|nr:LptF/LptG family permease [Alistipes sp.]